MSKRTRQNNKRAHGRTKPGRGEGGSEIRQGSRSRDNLAFERQFRGLFLYLGIIFFPKETGHGCMYTDELKKPFTKATPPIARSIGRRGQQGEGGFCHTSVCLVHYCSQEQKTHEKGKRQVQKETKTDGGTFFGQGVPEHRTPPIRSWSIQKEMESNDSPEIQTGRRHQKSPASLQAKITEEFKGGF